MAVHKLLYKPVHKLHGSRGETLVETLVAILVAALSVALLFSAVTASVEINKSARTADASYYETVSGAESQETPLEAASVTISENTVGGTPTSFTANVRLYGGNGIYSYKEVP